MTKGRSSDYQGKRHIRHGQARVGGRLETVAAVAGRDPGWPGRRMVFLRGLGDLVAPTYRRSLCCGEVCRRNSRTCRGPCRYVRALWLTRSRCASGGPSASVAALAYRSSQMCVLRILARRVDQVDLPAMRTDGARLLHSPCSAIRYRASREATSCRVQWPRLPMHLFDWDLRSGNLISLLVNSYSESCVNARM